MRLFARMSTEFVRDTTDRPTDSSRVALPVRWRAKDRSRKCHTVEAKDMFARAVGAATDQPPRKVGSSGLEVHSFRAYGAGGGIADETKLSPVSDLVIL
jgi:hypothetical protein